MNKEEYGGINMDYRITKDLLKKLIEETISGKITWAYEKRITYLDKDRKREHIVNIYRTRVNQLILEIYNCGDRSAYISINIFINDKEYALMIPDNLEEYATDLIDIINDQSDVGLMKQLEDYLKDK